ncbi:LLM class oxidoreductase [Exiguobacterium sp. U13-1]|uniref:TIGR03571 family LLM class oxidoreductase n=1 Tax=Exiguobacterium acetylicum TaxID=41170 RepID=A0ABX8GCX1_EXIAC|nr:MULTISPECIES: TIGR03571 family LLM class oxidoreductase [Exiguobacterium]AOT00496.1 LLM class oxidoreductase [Exiguobacterium sp. U13-1]QWB31460.1 TIGR03571 family LLM class oxidoreductase [Exiguobacterium acetylicum]
MYNDHASYQRMYREGELTLGLHVPLENFKMRTPTLANQVELAQKAENYGFTTLWLRDVLLKDPYFLDPAVGQIHDMLIYGTHLLSQTKQIALGTSALVLPLRHPLRSAKEVATIDALFPERLILGVSSGDRQADFHGLGVDHPSRGAQFKEALQVMEQALYEDYPQIDSTYGKVRGATLVPRPKKRIPTMITSFAQQDMDWLAKNGDGWMYYPQGPFEQARAIEQWRAASQAAGNTTFRPFSMPMHLDLSADPNEEATPIRLGFRIGRHRLIELLELYRELGVNHLFFALFDGKRSAEDVIDELGTYVVPHFLPLS